jgi:hypothetical protein
MQNQKIEKINKKKTELKNIPAEIIERKIFLIRGKKVMIDNDLSLMYDVPTKVLNQAVKRNSKRFPVDFMFQLSIEEKNYVVTNCDHLSQLKFSSNLPYVFSEQGVAMLSSVLNSEKAIAVNIQIIRTFVKLREMVISNKVLRLKIEDIEKKYDKRFKVVFDMLKNLMEEKYSKKEIQENKRAIGFKSNK